MDNHKKRREVSFEGKYTTSQLKLLKYVLEP